MITPTVQYLKDFRDDPQAGGAPFVVECGPLLFAVSDSTPDDELESRAMMVDTMFDDFSVETAFIYRLEGSIDTPQLRPGGQYHHNACSGCDDPQH